MLKLPHVLTHDEVEDTLQSWRQTLEQLPVAQAPAALTVDGTELKQFDSSALAVLLACRRMAQAKGLVFSVQSLPPKLTALAGLYGLEDLLTSNA
jgi:phospholipid transport system transporter-binding protein